MLQTFERVNDQDLLSIKIGDETIQVTPGHPFWVVRGEDLESRPWPEHAGERVMNAALQGRWVDAGDLRVGDVLYLKNGESREIGEIQVLEGGQQVYNFHVEELANYAVGEGCVLVHNASVVLGNDLLPYAGNVVSKPGFTDVIVHATDKSFHVLHNGKWVELSHRDLANFLKSKKVTGNLRLVSCEAGKAKLAKNLANKRGVTVEAATTKVGIPTNFTSSPLIEPGGQWNQFTPGK